MSNVMDYIKWRGDIPFEACGLNEVDNLIFCLLSYVDFDGILPDEKTTPMTIREAAKEYFFTRMPVKERPLGLIVPGEILRLFRAMADAPRYSNLRIYGYVNDVCEEQEMQFSALTVKMTDDTYYVAFRGTDDTLVGWKEDFNLSWMDGVPAQRMAAEYLDRLYEKIPAGAHLYVGGHSKGGNLAVWGAVHARDEVRAQIVRVYSNDGPGFLKEMLESQAFQTMRPRIEALIPQSSLVGLMLDHDEYHVIHSEGKGIFQHNGLSWAVMGSRFLREKSLSPRGKRNDTEVRERIAGMSREEKRNFTKLFFQILESTGARTLTELNDDSLRNAITMFRAMNDMDKENRETVLYLISVLFDLKPLVPVAARLPGKAERKLKVEFRWQWKRQRKEHRATSRG